MIYFLRIIRLVNVLDSIKLYASPKPFGLQLNQFTFEFDKKSYWVNTKERISAGGKHFVTSTSESRVVILDTLIQ